MNSVARSTCCESIDTDRVCGAACSAPSDPASGGRTVHLEAVGSRLGDSRGQEGAADVHPELAGQEVPQGVAAGEVKVVGLIDLSS